MSDICDALPDGYAYFTITVPPPQEGYTDTILKICVGSLLELNFSTIGEPQGVAPGATALDTAIALEDALNNRDTATLDTARDDYGMTVTRFNNILTVTLEAGGNCDEAVSMHHYTLASFSTPCGTPYFSPRFPYASACSPITCCPVPTEPQCLDYPANSLVRRVQFTNVSQVFGPGSGSLRKRGILFGTGFGVNLLVWDPGRQPQFDGVGYTSMDDWATGWANYYTTNPVTADLFHSITYEGGGVIEIVADTTHPTVQTWLAGGIPLGVYGVGTFDIDPELYAPMPMTSLYELNCTEPETPIVIDPPTPDDPPPPPDFTPPEVPPTPDYVAPACREFFDFECCSYSAGGVRRVLVIDKKYFVGYSLDDEGAVTDVETTVPVWYELCFADGVTVMEVSEDRSDAGVRFQVSLAVATHFMSQQNRNVLETLRRRRLVIIVEDANGRHWLMGEAGGARAENITGTTGAKGADGNNYAFIFRSFARVLPRVVSADVVEILQIGAVDCSQYVGLPLGDYLLSELADCLLEDMEDNDLI